MKKFLKKYKIVLTVVGALVVVLVALVLINNFSGRWVKDKNGNWVKRGNPIVHDFKSCAKRYPVMNGDPSNCQLPNGPRFYDINDFVDCAMIFAIEDTEPFSCTTNDGQTFSR